MLFGKLIVLDREKEADAVESVFNLKGLLTENKCYFKSGSVKVSNIRLLTRPEKLKLFQF